MTLPKWLNTYVHSLVGIAVAMIVIFFTLNWLHMHGPTFLRGVSGQAGNLASGQAYHFAS